MREERGQIAGDQIVSEPLELTGSFAGKVTVIDGGKMYLRGAVYGDLIVEEGGRVHVYGHISGSLIVEEGAKVIVSGVVGRDVINNGGRVFLDEMARVMGRLRRRAGETTIDPKARFSE
jgi:cytoskeletal protein CcmA (bactofilin family)